MNQLDRLTKVLEEKLPKYKAVYAEISNTTRATKTLMVALIPRQEMGSGRMDPVTGKEIIIGTIYLCSDSIEQLSSKVQYTLGLLQ